MAPGETSWTERSQTLDCAGARTEDVPLLTTSLNFLEGVPW